jgi:DNA-binding transcriptional ArsR family regulator
VKRHTVPLAPLQEDLTRVSEVFKALYEPIRLRLVLLLTDGERNVAELVKVLRLPQSTVSRHLAVLRATKLVHFERQGTRMVYRLSDAHLTALLVEAFSHAEHERLHLADHPLEDARKLER